MVDPYAVPIIAPAISFTTRRTAALAQKSRDALNIALAVVSAAVFRGASELHGFGGTTVAIPVTIVVISIEIAIVVGVVAMEAVTIVVAGTVHLTRVHDEIRAATVIDPDALLIESPAGSLNAG